MISLQMLQGTQFRVLSENPRCLRAQVGTAISSRSLAGWHYGSAHPDGDVHSAAGIHSVVVDRCRAFIRMHMACMACAFTVLPDVRNPVALMCSDKSAGDEERGKGKTGSHHRRTGPLQPHKSEAPRRRASARTPCMKCLWYTCTSLLFHQAWPCISSVTTQQFKPMILALL